MKYISYILSMLFVTSINVNAQDLTHKLYGYSQLDYKSSNDPKMDEGFHFRRVNLINDFNLQDNARFVVDVEFEDGTDIYPNSTTGSIKISRGFFEYNFKSNTSISFGKLLTPFGLFNETHDFTITYLPIEVPLPYRTFINNSGTNETRVYSKYATGISLKDASRIFEKINWVNQFTVANGLSESNKGSDNNHDKSLSLKTSFKYLKDENMYEAGGSAYTENDSSPFGGSSNKRLYTYGVHFKFENNNFNVTSELFYSRFNSSIANVQKSLAYYVCVGYTVDEKYTPYILTTKAYRDLSNKKNSDHDTIIGLNTNLLPQVILKLEYTKTDRDEVGVDKKYQTIASTLAIAF